MRSVGWALLAAGLIAACSVTRAPVDRRSDPAALPNLGRASQELQERIVREKEHVKDLNRQLEDLLASEGEVYAEVFEMEDTYQRLRADADDLRADVAAVDRELGGIRKTLETRTAERDAARQQLAAIQAELEAERVAGLEARREIEFWRGGLEADGEVRAMRQLRLEEFRKRWDIPADVWGHLLSDLGLAAVLIDPEHPPELPAPEPEQPLPPDSLPPPEGSIPPVEDAVADEAVVDEPAGI